MALVQFPRVLKTILQIIQEMILGRGNKYQTLGSFKFL